MGLFSSKRVTYTGVGSAVKNMLSTPVENSIKTIAVSAVINEADLGDTFVNTLAGGSGITLRSFINYANKHGYNNILGWRTTTLTGETFSNSTAYTKYLGENLYPSSYRTVETEPVVSSETEPQVESWYEGYTHCVVKRFTRTRTHTKTTLSDLRSFQVNIYYQGSNMAFKQLQQVLDNSTKTAEEADATNTQMFDEAFGVGSGTETEITAVTQTDNPINLVMLNEDDDTAPDVEGTVYLCCADALTTEGLIETHEVPQDDGTTVIDPEDITAEEIFKREANNMIALAGENTPKYIQDPITALNLNANVSRTQTVNVVIMISAYTDRTYETITPDPITNEDGTVTQPDPVTVLTKAVSHGTWLIGKASIVTNKEEQTVSDKILFAQVQVHHSKTQITDEISTEYSVIETYRDDVLVKTEELEGATHCDSNTEVLEEDEVTHNENYTYGSGNPQLDAILDNTETFTESFAPMMPIKCWDKFSSKKNFGDVYDAERKLYRKLSKKSLNCWDDLVDSFSENNSEEDKLENAIKALLNFGKGGSSSQEDSPKMIYYLPSVPINVDLDFTNEYFYHFFKWIAVNFGGMAPSGKNFRFAMTARHGAALDTDFQFDYNFYLRYQILSGKPPVPCKIHGYARYVVLGSEDKDMTSYQHKGDFNDGNILRTGSYSTVSTDYSFSHAREDYPSLTDAQYKELMKKNQFTVVDSKSGTTSLTLFYRISDGLYERIYLTNFVMGHYIRGMGTRYYLKNSLLKNWTKDAIDDIDPKNNGLSPIIIPIAKGALESMSWYRQTDLLQVCHNIVASTYVKKVVKIKWYQRGFIKVLVQIVAIAVVVVVSVYTGGAAAASASGIIGTVAAGVASAIGAGALCTAVIATMITMALKAIAVLLITKLITYVANKFIGGELGFIIGAIGSIAASWYIGNADFSSWGSFTNYQMTWSAMNTIDGYLRLGDVTLNKFNQYASLKIQDKYNDLQKDTEATRKQIEEYQNTSDAIQYKLMSWTENSWLTDIIKKSSYTPASQQSQSYPLLVESPDTYFSVHMGLDFYSLNRAYIDNFPDITNSMALPA